MHFFVTFTYSPTEMETYDFAKISEELATIGLKNAIEDSQGASLILPAFTFIGEYKYEKQEELKNILYMEVKRVFKEHNMPAKIYISVSENAAIGIDDLSFEENQ